MIDAHTKLCAVIGNPVEHSLSPAIHNAAFQSLNLNYVYVAFHVMDVAGCLAGMRALPSFRGMSVTIPHKRAVMDYLDVVDPMAVRVGAVNTITNEGGRLNGTTTDGPGALRAFAEADVSLVGKRILFLGAGGAVRSVAFAMAERANAAQITVLGRTASRVKELGGDLRAKTSADIATGDLGGDLAAAMTAHDVIVQGTSIGMYPNATEDSPIPCECLRTDHVVFDMVYRPLKTRLVREAEAAGCTTILGVEMLLHQAALQFEQWTGEKAPLLVMRRVLLDALAAGV